MIPLIPRCSRIIRVVFVLGVVCLATNFAATYQSFVVTSADNDGPGSLREAITNANATPGADMITFNIPGPGVKVINLTTPLPEITEAVVIDATTQPGYAGAPLIELNGQAITGFENGLVITAGNTTVRGLAIGRFFSGILLRSCDNNLIQGNYIGVDASGSQSRLNATGIRMSASSNNVIGGTSAAARNVISGNLEGILINGAGNVIQGNFIGTNAAGTAAIGNIESGVNLLGPNNVIGGNSAGAGNLISGNNADGIYDQASGNTIQGNLIGTDVTGTKKVPNGIGIKANVLNTVIGGLTPGARNLISGNASIGVVVSGSGSKLQGNFIGTDITGTLALGNDGDGVSAGNNALIGGTIPEARNVIAGNGDGGFGNVVLDVNPNGPGAIVQGNYIGTDVTGTRALNESTFSGITILSDNNLIGGLVPGAQNVISGNIHGIIIDFFSPGPQQNIIQGNLIGLNAQGTGPLPNSASGIRCNCFKNTIGGTQSEAANKIAFNGGAGITVFAGTGNSFRGNSIFSNGGLGIDLKEDGVTANDVTDSDAGANNLQNFPVLTSVTSNGNSTTINGSLNSIPNTTFQIDFYSNAVLDLTGNGEGALFFGTAPLTTNGNGDATINVTVPSPLPAGRVLTATATDPDGNTSEFSASNVAGAGANVQFSVSSIRVVEDIGLVTITVLRKGSSSGSLTVDYATVDGTATAGQDYTSISGSLTFSNGETTKTIQIPILDDAVTEPDETFTVVLHASNLETLGAPATLVVTLQSVPMISSNAPSVVEGDTGTTTEALFTFTLSAATGRTVSVNYATQNSNAFGSQSCSNPGTDYETISGTISFPPGSTSVIIPVKICGDNSAEVTERFRLNLTSPVNAIVDSTPAIGTILDDDFLELLLEDSGQVVNQVAALDAFLMLRDPFRVALPDWFPTTGPDRNTRVMFFVRGLQLNPGEFPSAVNVVIVDEKNLTFTTLAEDVRAVPNTDFSQVVFRLPNNIHAGTYTVAVVAHFRTSNGGTMRIAP